MKQHRISFLLVLVSYTVIASLAVAQPVLTGANSNPVAGDFLDNHQGLLSGPAAITFGGAGQTWDMSAYYASPFFFANVVAASSTPYSALFPAANIAFTGNEWDYYLCSATEFTNVGTYHSNAAETFYSDYQKVLVFPFAYGNSFTDSFALVRDTTYSHGNVTANADGYGGIALPWGSVSNCLRVHTVISEVDSTPLTLASFQMDQYTWYKPGVHFPICTYSIFESGPDTLYLWQYLDSSVIGVEEISGTATDFSVGPNPFESEIRLTTPERNAKKITVVVCDITGQTVFRKEEDYLVAGLSNSYDLELLSPGLYFLTLTIDGLQTVKKIIKQS